MLDEKQITIVDDGTELRFRLRRMPATQAEFWVLKAGLALLKTGLVDEMAAPVEGMDAQGVITAGLAAVRKRGFSLLGHLDPETVKGLCDELLAPCSRILNNYNQPLTAGTLDGFIRDFRTLLTLRKEAFMLNFGFFFAAVPSDSQQPGEEQEAEKTGRKRSISARSKA